MSMSMYEDVESLNNTPLYEEYTIYENITELYDDDTIDTFQLVKELYYPFHGFLSLIVCFFGIIANVANIIVLTRKEMVTPTNSILTGLAVADMLVMVDYIPYTIHNYIGQDKSRLTDLFSYGWAVFALFHAHFSVICHTISTWLTVLLAVWRYIAVRHPIESKVWCSKDRTSYFIAGTYVAVIIACIPGYMTFTIMSEEIVDNVIKQNVTVFKVGFSDIAKSHDGLLMTFHFWVFSVATKLAPCILLTYLSLTLIKALIEADKRKKRLKSSRPTPMVQQSAPQMVVTQAGTPTQQQQQQETPFSQREETLTADERRDANDDNDDNAGDDNPEPGQVSTPTTDQPKPNDTIVTMVTSKGLNGTNTKTTYKSTLAVHSSIHNKERQSSTSSSCPSGTQDGQGHRSQGHQQQHKDVKESSTQNDRTNRMLIAVLLLFLITEFPSGILVLLSGILGDAFFNHVYSPLGELMDILALVNSSINFILYCSMSSIFRSTFISIFCKCFQDCGQEDTPNERTPIKSTNTAKSTMVKMTPTPQQTPNNNRRNTTTTTTIIVNNLINQDDQHVMTTNL